MQAFTTSTQGIFDAPVGTIRFGAEIESVVADAVELLGDSEVLQFARESYRPGETFGSAFGRLFARLFADWGVILLDASDPALSEISQPIYRSAIEGAVESTGEIANEGQRTRGRWLSSAG